VFNPLAQNDRIRFCAFWLEGTGGVRSVKRKLARGSFGRKKYEAIRLAIEIVRAV
jgi:hypothetical protein